MTDRFIDNNNRKSQRRRLFHFLLVILSLEEGKLLMIIFLKMFNEFPVQSYVGNISHEKNYKINLKKKKNSMRRDRADLLGIEEIQGQRNRNHGGCVTFLSIY